MQSLYIVVVDDYGETFQYEFGNIKHAREQFDSELRAQLLEYIDGEYHLVEAK